MARRSGVDWTNLALAVAPVVACLAVFVFARIIVAPLTANIPICAPYDIVAQPEKPAPPPVDPTTLPENWKGCAALHSLAALPPFEGLHLRAPIAAEVKARYAWSALYALGMIGAAAISLYCALKIFSFLPPRRAWRRIRLAIIVAAVTAALVYAADLLTNPLVRQMFDNTLDLLPGPWPNHSLGGLVRAFVAWANVLTVVTIVFIVTASASTAASLRERQAEHRIAAIAVRLRALSHIAYAASLGLVLLTLAGYQLFSWPATMLPAGASAAGVYQALAQGIVLVTGAGLTALLAVSYLAPAAILMQRANRLIPETLDGMPAREKWLKDNGVEFAPRQQLAQLASFLLPLLAAAGTSLFKELPFV